MKKILALVLAIIMIAGTLTACGGKEPTNQTEETKSTDVETDKKETDDKIIGFSFCAREGTRTPTSLDTRS